MFSRYVEVDGTFRENKVGLGFDIKERVQDISSNWKVVTINNKVYKQRFLEILKQMAHSKKTMCLCV